MISVRKNIVWKNWTVVYCAILFVLAYICNVSSEKLQCLEKHILNTEQSDGLYLHGKESSVCQLESWGQHLNSSICTVWDFGYQDCENSLFVHSTSKYMRNVVITPYVQPKMSTANFNVTLLNHRLLFLKYRIRIGENTLCHQLQLQPSVGRVDVSFACNVFSSWAAGLQAEMIINAGDDESLITAHADYLMEVPRNKTRVDPSNTNISITEWVIFIVVEISHKPDLLVTWPAVPGRFNVTTYRVQPFGEETKDVSSSCEDGYCFFEYFAGYNARTVNFSVQPVHADCQDSCFSFSPSVKLEFSLPLYLLVMIGCVPVLVLAVCICSVYYFCCVPPRESPVVMLLFDATQTEHCRVVRLLAEYLEKQGSIRCLLPDNEIPYTESQSPIKWLMKTLDEADAVLVVASPESHLEIRYNEYPDILFDALPMIEQRRKCPTHDRAGRFLVGVPPYCCEENVPLCLRDVPRVMIPEEMGWLLWSLYNQPCWLTPFIWMVKLYLQSCWCPGPMSAYSCHGQRLEQAVEDAVAVHKLANRGPHSPVSSRRTIWTRRNMPEESETISLPMGNFPGNLQNLPLMGSSAASDNLSMGPPTAVPKGAIDIEGLQLG